MERFALNDFDFSASSDSEEEEGGRGWLDPPLLFVLLFVICYHFYLLLLFALNDFDFSAPSDSEDEERGGVEVGWIPHCYSYSRLSISFYCCTLHQFALHCTTFILH